MGKFIINKRHIEDNENSSIIINSAKKPKIIHKYDDNYLSFGYLFFFFFWTENERSLFHYVFCVVKNFRTVRWFQRN